MGDDAPPRSVSFIFLRGAPGRRCPTIWQKLTSPREKIRYLAAKGRWLATLA